MTVTTARVSRFRLRAVSRALIVALANLWLAPVYAQSGSAPARGQATQGRVENTQVVINGAIVNISYDLVAARGQSTFAVELEASQDGGKTYMLKPKTVTGDVGAGVAAGAGKRLVWEAAKDTDNLQLAQLKFRVVAKNEASRATQAPPPPTTPPSAVAPRQPQPAPPDTSPKPVQPQTAGGRNTFLWPGLGAIGGGVLIGALAAKGPLRSTVEVDDPFLPTCLQIYAPRYGSSFCDFYRSTSIETNKPVVGVGLGIAGVGAALIFLGKRKAASRLPSIAPVSKGFVVFRTVQF